MLQPGTWAVAATFHGKLWVANGNDENDRPTATLQVYDPLTDIWRLGPPMPTARWAAAAAFAAGKLFVIGGADSHNIPTSVVETFRTPY
jgi:hypothetical protein